MARVVFQLSTALVTTTYLSIAGITAAVTAGGAVVVGAVLCGIVGVVVGSRMRDELCVD